MAGIDEYSTTPGSNTAINGIDIDEDCDPSGVNNAIRQFMADVRAAFNDIGGKAVTAGTNTVTLTTETVYTAYADGTILGAIIGGTNTGATTLNVDTVGAKKVLNGTAELAAGEQTIGRPALWMYDASADSGSGAWLLLNPYQAASFQPLDADLTAIAALTTTSYGRALLALADAAALAALTSATAETLTNKTISAASNTITMASTALSDTSALTYNADTDVSANGWVVDEDDMSSDLATKVPTQQSVKAYVDGIVSGGAVVADFSTPTSDVGSIAVTGLSDYRRVTVMAAVQLTANGPAMNLEARVSGGTWRVLISSGTTSGINGSAFVFALIERFNEASGGKMFVAAGDAIGGSMDNSNAINSGDAGSFRIGFAAYDEVWDEVRIVPSAGNIEGSTTDQRGRLLITGQE